jgi:hypothetical protein
VTSALKQTQLVKAILAEDRESREERPQGFEPAMTASGSNAALVVPIRHRDRVRKS